MTIRKIKIYILLTSMLVVLLSSTLLAQSHQDSWFRLTLSKPITSKINFDIETQHRRQNAFAHKSMFSKNLMYSFRVWSHYQINRNIKFSLSPFGYFSQYKIIQSQYDNLIAPTKEIRLSAALEMQHFLGKKLYFTDRVAVEYRMLNHIAPITRIRTRFGLRYDFTDKAKLQLSDEIFANISGAHLAHHLFDQNRVQLGAVFNPKKHIKFEVAYMLAQRLPLSSNQLLFEKNLLFNVGFNID